MLKKYLENFELKFKANFVKLKIFNSKFMITQ
jgi:hypothetical protein